MASVSSTLRERIERDAKRRCGYCHVPQQFLPVRLEVEHLIPESLLGRTVRKNLWLSCPLCNRHKGSSLTGNDPSTGKTIRLFNPRTDKWKDHFSWSEDGLRVIGKTPVGRATIAVLALNHDLWMPCRRYWVLLGMWPPKG